MNESLFKMSILSLPFKCVLQIYQHFLTTYDMEVFLWENDKVSNEVREFFEILQ